MDVKEWRRFLENHTVPIVADAAAAGASPGKYTINIRFVVNRDGTLSDISLLNDPGYGIGKKLLEVLRSNAVPRWRPATQNGRVVRSYHIQPVTFVIPNT